mmetsp:Transcript_27998/g.73425  ORF Transcript_27998/g.73425 Transcript_27998/m.73425 type:complete len:238 (-) Transcript_27998:2823-3536(-)
MNCLVVHPIWLPVDNCRIRKRTYWTGNVLCIGTGRHADSVAAFKWCRLQIPRSRRCWCSRTITHCSLGEGEGVGRKGFAKDLDREGVGFIHTVRDGLDRPEDLLSATKRYGHSVITVVSSGLALMFDGFLDDVVKFAPANLVRRVSAAVSETPGASCIILVGRSVLCITPSIGDYTHHTKGPLNVFCVAGVVTTIQHGARSPLLPNLRCQSQHRGGADPLRYQDNAGSIDQVGITQS